MAATDSRPVPIKNVAFRAVFPILDADGDLVTGATGLDSEVSKDQGTFADCTNEATEIATSSGIYYLDLTSTEMNADCVSVIVKTSTVGAKTTVLVLYPEETGDINVDVTAFGGTAGTFSAGRPEVNTSHAAGTAWGSGAITAASIATAAITAAKFGAGAIDAAAIANGAIDAATFAAGAINAAAIAADAITDAKVASDVTIASVTGAVGSVTGAVGSVTGNVGGNVVGSVGSVAGNVTGSIGSLATQAKADVEAEVGDAMAAYHVVMVKTTIATLASQTRFTLTAGSADNDAYNGCEIVIEDSATAAQKAVGVVDDYTGATKTVTLRTDPAVFTMAVGDVVTIRPSRSLKSTVDNRTADVTPTGEVGIDWANVGTPGSAVNLSATTVNLVNTLTTYTGNTVQTGDSFARIGATGSGLTSLASQASLNTVDGIVDDILLDTAEIGAAGAGLTAINLPNQTMDIVGNITGNLSGSVGSVTGAVGSVTAGVTLAASAVQAIWDALTSALTTAGSIGKLLVDNINATISSRSSQTSVDDLPTNAELATSQAAADDATLAAIAALNNLSSAGAQAAAEAALVTHRLDELLNADSDIDGLAPPTVGSVFHELMSKTAGSFTFDQTTDSNEAIRDRGDAAWITATGFSTLDAAGVRTAVGLAAANLDTQLGDIPTVAEFDARTLLAAAYGTAANQTTIAAFIDTEVAAILAAVDTEIAAILALLDDPRTEPGQGAPPVNPDLATKIDYLYKAWRNKKTQTSSTQSLYADDGTTVDQKATLSDDGSTLTVGEIATGP